MRRLTLPAAVGFVVLFALRLLSVVVVPPEAAAQASPEAGQVTALLPVVRLARGAAAPVEARLRDPVFWRDWVETDVRARARLALLDGSLLNLGSGARVQVLRHDAATQQTELELQYGKLRSTVQKLTRADSRFEIRTNTAVVGAIGTHFFVEATDALTRVLNFEGRVRVRNADPAVPGEVILEPLELAEVERGQPPRKRLASPEELWRALEDTLPGLVARLEPAQASAGSCVSATTAEAFLDTDGDGALARTSFLEILPRACTAPDITPVRVCVPENAKPGLYEYPLSAADGSQRWSAFQVQPSAPRQDARLIYSPELPPGATHYARLVDRDNHPLAGVAIHVRREGKEEIIHTDSNGGFTVQAPEKGKLEMEVEDEPATSGAPLATPERRPLRAAIKILERPRLEPDWPAFGQRGSVVQLPGEVRAVKLGGLELPVARTTTRTGRTASSVVIPPDVPEGPSALEIEDASGERRRHPLRVYEVLAARLTQPALTSGAATDGEFLVCLGRNGDKLRKVRARIEAAGPVHFRGKGARGKRFEGSFAVGPSGLLRIPFAIQAEKGAPGAGIPFTLTLHLEND